MNVLKTIFAVSIATGCFALLTLQWAPEQSSFVPQPPSGFHDTALVQDQSAQRALDQPTKTDQSNLLQVDGLIRALDEIQIPAKRNGMITELKYRKGDSVAKLDVIAQIDTTDASALLAVAIAELNAAEANAKDDSRIQSAKAELAVSRAEQQTLNQVGASAATIEHLRINGEMKVNSANLQTSVFNKKQAELAAQVSAAKLRVAQLDVSQRTIHSPINGMVVKVNNQNGEWVEVGDPVMSIVRLDVLMAEGFVKLRDVPPHRISGASVSFKLANSPREFRGKITAAAKVDVDGKYQVWFELKNQKSDDLAGISRWVLRPGMAGEMRIDLSRTASSDTAMPARGQDSVAQLTESTDSKK